MTSSPQVDKGSLLPGGRSPLSPLSLHWHPRGRKIPCYCWAGVGVWLLLFWLEKMEIPSTSSHMAWLIAQTVGFISAGWRWKFWLSIWAPLTSLHFTSLLLDGGESLDSPVDLHQHCRARSLLWPRRAKSAGALPGLLGTSLQPASAAGGQPASSFSLCWHKWV